MDEKKKNMRLLLISVACAAIVFTAMAVFGNVSKKNAEKEKETTATSSQSTDVTDNSKPVSVHLLAVGDNLIHDTIIKSGRNAEGGYNFDSLYSEMKSTISDADIAVINQETVLGGSEFEYSGYPLFNSPQEIGDAAINAGFDVFLGATNHTMDQGSKGILSEIAYYKKHPEITYLGVNESKEEYESVKIVEKNGIKIAMLNYTFGLNGISLPDDKPWIVNMLDDKDKIKADIAAAKSKADVIVVFPHWGTEYSMEISTSQTDYVNFFAENGVDLVIGAHPHVIEPVQQITTDGGHKMLVYYSLGNFISHQNGADRMLGAMADVTITKTGNEITVDGKAVPLVTHIVKNSDSWEFKVYKLSDYTDELAKAHRESSVSLSSLNELASKTLGEFLAE